MSIVWKKVIVNTSHDMISHQKKPTITINCKSGRVAFNAAACGMIPDLFFYDYAAVVQGLDGDKQIALGIQFLRSEAADETDFRIHKVKRDDNSIRSCVITSKKLARLLSDNAQETCVFQLTKVNDFMLSIRQPTAEKNVSDMARHPI